MNSPCRNWSQGTLTSQWAITSCVLLPLLLVRQNPRCVKVLGLGKCDLAFSWFPSKLKIRAQE